MINTANASVTNDSDPSNDDASDPTNILSDTDLTITKTHSPPTFLQGGAGDYNSDGEQHGQWRLERHGNGDGYAARRPNTWLRHGSWLTCGTVDQDVTCMRTDAVAAGMSAPPITLPVTVAGDAPSSVVNTASVSGGGDIDPTDNSDSDLTPIAPTPTINPGSLSPSVKTVGDIGFVLTATGSGFATNGTAVVSFGGADLASLSCPGTCTSSFHQATVTGSDGGTDLLMAAGSPDVTIRNGAGTPSNPAIFTINARPVIDNLAPASASAGDDTFTLTVNGSNFLSDMTVTWGGDSLLTTFGSAAQLFAVVDASRLTLEGEVTVRVVSSGGSQSNGSTFKINPAGAPSLGLINPSQVIAGGATFVLTATGSNFVSGFKIKWDRTTPDLAPQELLTTFVNDQTLVATVDATLIVTEGGVDISVLNTSGSAESNTLPLTIGAGAPPELTSLSPVSVTAGESGFTLIVNGQNFVSSSTVHWTGGGEDTDLTTVFLGNQALSAQVPETLIDKVDVSNIPITISLMNPDSTNTKTFTIQPALEPTITSLSPDQAQVGDLQFQLSVVGGNFVLGAKTLWDDGLVQQELTTVFLTPQLLQATVPSPLLTISGTSPETRDITVKNPRTAGKESGPDLFTIIPNHYCPVKSRIESAG